MKLPSGERLKTSAMKRTTPRSAASLILFFLERRVKKIKLQDVNYFPFRTNLNKFNLHEFYILKWKVDVLKFPTKVEFEIPV